MSDSYIAKSAISLHEGNVHNRIGESKYSDADRYFDGCGKKRASFEWFVIEYELTENQSETAAEDVMKEDIRLLEQLKASYEGFSISE